MFGEARSKEREPFSADKIRLATSIGEQAASALDRVELFAQLEQSYLQTVLALANAVDAKDNYTADHAQRLAEMALTIGRELGVTGAELEALRYGAILHDIGKIGVPDAVLQEPSRPGRMGPNAPASSHRCWDSGACAPSGRRGANRAPSP